MTDGAAPRWLLLLYQFPKGPDARRVTVWRRLQRLGAVAIKHAAYVLPRSAQSREDLEWLLAELRSHGADGAILEAQLVDGMTDAELRELFNDARAADYRQLQDDVAAAIADAGGGDDAARDTARRALARARKRLAEIQAIDFFAAPGQRALEQALRTLAERAALPAAAGNREDAPMTAAALDDLKDRVWVTRRGVHVDRIACAWLIRRRIDPEARFKFVAGSEYAPRRGELRFDMFDAEYTHDGDRCTFEVLADLVCPDDAGMRSIGEIVHDIDLKDGKFERPETGGVAALIAGIVAASDDDEQRIARGSALFDDLHRSLPGPAT